MSMQVTREKSAPRRHLAPAFDHGDVTEVRASGVKRADAGVHPNGSWRCRVLCDDDAA
jgi:hypothetical protein